MTESEGDKGGSSVIDFSSPYYLHPSDSPKQPSVNEKPETSSSEYKSWMRCDAMIKGWLTTTMKKGTRDSVKYANTSLEIWSDLKERFGKESAPRAYELKKKITATRQEGSSVLTYYTRLRASYEELDWIGIRTGSEGDKGRSSVIDFSSPYYLHPSDSPKQPSVNVVLTDGNYNDWAREMTNFLFAKNKTDFVDGTLKKPETSSSEYKSWMRCDAMIKDLKERFGKKSAPRAYELKKKITATRQEGSSVSTYYTSLSIGKEIMTLNEQILDLNKLLSKEKSTISFLLEEKKKLTSDFKTRKDELLDKQIQLEKKIKELNNILVKTCQSIQTIHMLSPKPDSFYHTEQKMALGYQNPFYFKKAHKKQQSLYDGKVLLEKHDPLVVHDSEETLQLA
uniref:Retrotransposon Copia-like N-terminal domain-containing protein n=1 Tax=Tanacetum cinerariifolium TaxID=118510 RepID=A0A6L2KKP3_TANCI|nr:hypothetical protein [Tanacetum cinerariifolium]